MNNWKKFQIGKAISFNPKETLVKKKIARKIPMANLTEFHKKINGYEYAEYKSGPKFRNEDTLMAKITPCLENGKTAKVDILEDDEVAFGSSEFIVLRKTSFTIPDYIYYLAISPTFRKRAISCMEGTSGRKRVNENTLKYFELPFPSIEEQKQLSKVLSDLDAKIEVNNKINQELEAMAKLVYDYWFVQFDFPMPEDYASFIGKPELAGKPYKSSGGKMVYNAELKRNIPEGWEDGTLSDIANITMGQSPSGSSYNEEAIGTVFYQGSTDFGQRFPTVRKYTTEPSRMAKEGDILLSVRAPVGTLNQAMENCCIGRGLAALNEKEGSISFLWSQMEYFKQIFDRRNASGTTFGSITKDDLFSLKLCIPEKQVLERFKSIADPFHEKIVITSKENQKLSELRDWLLPMLMNGQVRVGSITSENEYSDKYIMPSSELLNVAEGQVNYSLFEEQNNNVKARLQAQILTLAIEAHAKLNRNLYRTKGEKLIEVIEKHVSLDFGRKATKMAAGPADFEYLVTTVEPLAKRNYWFFKEKKKLPSGRQSNKYTKGSSFNDFLKEAQLENQENIYELERVIDLFAELNNTREAEVVATTYTAWNNLIIREEKITDNAIVKEAREDWHKKKLEIAKAEFKDAIKWLRNNNLVPKGTGNEVL
ncbi:MULTISPECIES: restriction endonuclease subunit S [Leeuwenhoekiella]|uniref:restriction endonuclease subunit S n=1 Tax=Leeuwenhoekiella TaxID=283735 RepID=UPI000C544476|nr:MULTISPECIES: restriction endonuclease subunit S [Leeuwenhoekiella]MAO41925.1 hypothetical protein [Leeuwenhoekiella sp.]|tara:strand:- start:987 stop:2945 length:1959 start_codon:yes stop_codon:yes gene_type:complete